MKHFEIVKLPRPMFNIEDVNRDNAETQRELLYGKNGKQGPEIAAKEGEFDDGRNNPEKQKTPEQLAKDAEYRIHQQEHLRVKEETFKPSQDFFDEPKNSTLVFNDFSSKNSTEREGFQAAKNEGAPNEKNSA